MLAYGIVQQFVSCAINETTVTMTIAVALCSGLGLDSMLLEFNFDDSDGGATIRNKAADAIIANASAQRGVVLDRKNVIFLDFTRAA